MRRARPEDRLGQNRQRACLFCPKEDSKDEQHPRKNWPRGLTGMPAEGAYFHVTEGTLGAVWELRGMESAVASRYSLGPTKCHRKASPSPPPLPLKSLGLISRATISVRNHSAKQDKDM